MIKPIYTFTIIAVLSVGMTGCSNESGKELNETESEVEQVDLNVDETPQEEENTLGNFEGLVGDWTVDAATAGVQMDLTFGKDMSFVQKMGTINGEGTWEIIDETHIRIVTQNTKGQNWEITDLTTDQMKLNWKPDSPNPKIIPMNRVK